MNLTVTKQQNRNELDLLAKEAQFHRPTKVKQKAGQGGQQND